MGQSIRHTQWARALGIIIEQSIIIRQSIRPIIEQSIRHNQWARVAKVFYAFAPSWWGQSQKVLFRASYYALPQYAYAYYKL